MTKKELLNKYIDVAIKKAGYPTLEELPCTREQMRTHFVKLEGLKKAAIATGKLDKYIFDLEHLPEDYISKSLAKVSRYKRFVITSVVMNNKVNAAYLENIRTYCKKENALLLIIPTLLKNPGMAKYGIDPVLKNEVVVYYDLPLNSNIKILGIANNAKATDPTTGLPRLGKRNGSIIVGSPKQNMKLVPTGISKLPHALMSTGAITAPKYSHTAILKNKSDVLADNDHVTGALIVELDGDRFHFRGTQADKHNGFTDLGWYYRDGKKTRLAPEALVGGDIHVTETCPTSEAAMFDIIKRTGAKQLIAHDIFTARSCNHHEMEKRLFLANRAAKDELSVDLEIEELAIWLKQASTKVDKVVVVRSNHDEFLDRYLESGAYTEHPYNHRIALNLALHVLDGLNPLEESCKQRGVLSYKVKWLKRDESYKLGGIELGAHGDKGANGSKGSAKSLEEGYGPCVYGHTHTPSIMRSAYCVGTNTATKPYYGSGPNSWFNTDCLVYGNGVRQLINKIEGKYTTRKL